MPEEPCRISTIRTSNSRLSVDNDMNDEASDSQRFIEASIVESARVVTSLTEQSDQIDRIATACVDAIELGQKIMTMGHGGSAADALHMSEELLGRFDADRRPLPAIALVADPTLLTCIANDYGFQHVFSRQIEGLGAAGDVLVIFSTSGNGEGLRLAVDAARKKNVVTVGVLGKGGGEVADHCEYTLIVDSDSTARIQEAHTLFLHLILERIDQRFADSE